MATGGLNAIRENLFYVGGAKQSAWGTDVAPTWFYYWLDGTDLNPEMKLTTEREGDTTPHLSLVYKSAQYAVIKIVEYARPIMAGYALESVCGASSDTYTAPTKSTTLAASVAAGASTFQSTGDLGNVGTMAINVEPAYSSTTYEVVTANLVSRTGAGPYTYTLANSGTFKNAHSNSGVITSQASHVFKRQGIGYDPYSLEFAYGSAASAISQVVRMKDCVCTDLSISSEVGRPVRFEHTWYGTASLLKGAPTAIAQEYPPMLGGPFQHFQANGNWTLDGLTTGNAVTIRSAKIEIKNSTSPDDFITETLNPAYFLPGNFDCMVALEAVFNSFSHYLETYWGSSSAGAGTSDSLTVPNGAFLTTWTYDAINSLAISLPTVNYQAAKLTPRLDGKPLRQAISGVARRTPSATDPFIATLTNSQASAY